MSPELCEGATPRFKSSFYKKKQNGRKTLDGTALLVPDSPDANSTQNPPISQAPTLHCCFKQIVKKKLNYNLLVWDNIL